MPSPPPRVVTLTPHPDTPSREVNGIDAQVSRMPGGMLAVTYIVAGHVDHLRIPSPRPPRFADRLWQHMCCELFIAHRGVPGYREYNLSPSGEWAAYAFAHYRERVTLTVDCDVARLNPQITLRRTSNKLELDALLPLDCLSPLYASGPLALALSVVAEDQDGSLSYWALKHPPGKPDFHHADGFALELE